MGKTYRREGGRLSRSYNLRRNRDEADFLREQEAEVGIWLGNRRPVNKEMAGRTHGRTEDKYHAIAS